MHRSQRPDALVAPLREDVLSGATQLARRASHALAEVTSWEGVETSSELRGVLTDVGLRILDAQPAMAPLVALVAAVLNALDGVERLDEAREAARHSALAFASSLDRRAEVVAERAAELLPDAGDILTLSSSSTVLGALLQHPRHRSGRIVVLESRPASEGRDMARRLAEAGIPVLFAADAAAATVVEGCSAVLFGADSLGDRGVVNKVGSLPATLAALRAAVPVLVATDATKILPPGFPQPLDDDRPDEQLWEAPEGVVVWNRYFEAVPLAAVDVVVTDVDAFRPGELEAYRSKLAVPRELEAWARRRGAHGG